MIFFSESVKSAALDSTHIFSVGQAGFIIKSSSGQLLGIDLYLSDCVERVEGHDGYKRLIPKLFEPIELEFDYIIATHYHRDHFDVDAVPELLKNGKSKLLAAFDCSDDIQSLHLLKPQFQLVKPGDELSCGDFTLRFLNCDHGSGAPEAVGVIVETDGLRILETGDTCLRLDRTEEYKYFGQIDVLIAPINGAYGNLNEADCVQLADAIKPSVTIPCHYGMFASHGGNPGLFRDLMIEKQLPYRIMTLGERYTLNNNNIKDGA